MVVYPSYTTCVNTRACDNGAELAIFEINFYWERNSVDCGELLTSVQVRDHGKHQGNPTETQALHGNLFVLL